MKISDSFPRYREHDPQVPVYCVTPHLPGTIHRFYDTSPFSPSGRYIAVTQLASELRLPKPGDSARIILVDLEHGDFRCVAETQAWDTQLGAQLQWGGDDNTLFFNMIDNCTWQPYGVKLDLLTGACTRLNGSVYMVTGDGTRIASPCLRRLARTQPGYGVVVPDSAIPANHGASLDDGIYLTDPVDGSAPKLLPIAKLVEGAGLGHSSFAKGDFYVFHVKWNPQGTRLMVILRWLPHRPGGLEWVPWRFGRHLLLERLGRTRRDSIVTCTPDGSDVHLAVSATEWAKGGHHPNWCPDGRRILMNLNAHGDGMRFMMVDYDGRNQEVICSVQSGSGHPTLSPDGRHILTDAYPNEPVAAGDGTSPIRWIDTQRCSEKVLLHIHTVPPFLGPRRELRVDPHPAWDRSFRYIAFNGCPSGGTRHVFVADLTALT